MRMALIACTALGIIATAGCNGSSSSTNTSSGTNQVETRSTIDQTIGTVLQYDTLKAGRSAQDRAKKLVTEHNKRVDEALPGDM